MSVEQLKVLEMLQDGKLTPDEALRLLNHIPDDREHNSREFGSQYGCDRRHPSGRFRHHGHHTHNHRRVDREDLDFSWITDLTNQFVDAAMDFSSYVSKQDWPGFFGGKIQRTNFSSERIESSEVKELRLTGKNDNMEISGYDGDTIELEVSYRQRNENDPQISFEEDGDCYRLFYDDKALTSIGFFIRVPEKLPVELHIENKNSPVKLSDLTLKKAEVWTKNAPIRLSDVDVENELKLETSNAQISIDDTKAKKIELKTSNAKISTDDCEANKIKISTSNASIHTHDCDFRDISAHTSNGGIIIDGLCSSNHQYSVYNVEARTSNGSITVTSDFDEPSACKIKASTSLSNIKVDCPGLRYTSNTNGYMDAKSEDYDESLMKLNLNLQTSQCPIKVKTL